MTTRFYSRDFEDKHNTINRCFADAEQGRLELALERIRDLLEEFPEDASSLYAEGLLLRDYLGSGLESKSLFERAFQATKPGDEVRGLAACNITAMACSEKEFEKWSAIARQILPKDAGLKALGDSMAEAKQQGVDYYMALVAPVVAASGESSGQPGMEAALLEVALDGGAFRTEDEMHMRKHRSTLLRKLDAMAAHTREMFAEYFLSSERLALHRALEENEKALSLDEFDPELWNFRSAWCGLLCRDEEAVTCAEKSIALRSHKYAKPWINKANALWHMKRFDEARECAREAVRQAEAAGMHKDREQAEALASLKGTGYETPGETQYNDWVNNYRRAAAVTSKKEVSQKGWSGNYDELVKGILKRTRPYKKEWDPAYFRIVTEMLSLFSPETTCFVLVQTGKNNRECYGNALNALVYIIVHSWGVLQRDAARLLCLMLFCTRDLKDARQMYRQAVMETSAASPEFVGFPKIICAELEKINPWLVQLIAEQEPIDARGVERARETVL